MAVVRAFQLVLTVCCIKSIAAIQVHLHLNKTELNPGESLRVNCTAPSNHIIALYEIGESFVRVKLLHNNVKEYGKDDMDCNTDINNTCIITEMTVTEKMHGKSIQCKSFEWGMDQVQYYSKGAYITVVGVEVCPNMTMSGTTSPVAEEQLDEESLVLALSDESISLVIGWNNPRYSPYSYFAYVVSAVLVSSGEAVAQETVVVAKGSWPLVEFSLHQYTCEEVNISVQVFNSNKSISKLTHIPARLRMFQKNVTADTFMINGHIKKLEVAFTPPRLCDFQIASYTLAFSSGNESWSRDPVPIHDTASEVKEDIETGFERNRNYTLTITIMIDGYENFTSSADFIFFYEEEVYPSTSVSDVNSNSSSTTSSATLPSTQSLSPTGTGPTVQHLSGAEKESFSPWLGAIVGSTGGLVLVGVCLAVGVALCFIKVQRKRRQVAMRDKMPRPNVTNPIYESGEDVYEELPDIKGADGQATYSDVAPPLPSARYDHLPPLTPAPGNQKIPDTTTQDQKEESLDTTSISHTPKRDPNEKEANLLTVPSSSSCGALSVHSVEDCYTVMNPAPAGTMSVVPRSRGSGLGSQWGAPPTGE